MSTKEERVDWEGLKRTKENKRKCKGYNLKVIILTHMQ